LLVIDDDSNSNDLPLNTSDIPTNSMPSAAQTTHIQGMPSSPLSTNGKLILIKEKQNHCLLRYYRLNINLFRCCKSYI
jgi:hypothetical protein